MVFPLDLKDLEKECQVGYVVITFMLSPTTYLLIIWLIIWFPDTCVTCAFLPDNTSRRLQSLPRAAAAVEPGTVEAAAHLMS